jgi:hypothetical protein
MKLPPFGKLADKHPSTAELRIYLGDNPQSWNVARLRNSAGPALLLPAGEDFSGYRWPVSGREVLLMLLGPYYQVQEFATHLLSQGAWIVRVPHGDKLDIYRHGNAKGPVAESVGGQAWSGGCL